VALRAVGEGVAPPAGEAELREAIRLNQWEPAYYDLPL